jgi:hypothetical protein
VADRTPECRAKLAEYGSIGGNIGWANTKDRAGRAAHMRANSPTELAWHARQLGLDPENLTPTEVKRAENARKAYFLRLRMKAEDAKAAKRKAAALRRSQNAAVAKARKAAG